MTPLGIGVVGTGDIAPRYLAGIGHSARLRLAGCAGGSPDRVAAIAGRFGCGAFDLAGLLGSADVDLVVNLATPREHHAVTSAALAAGKHVYSEKPLGITTAEGDALVAAARVAGRTLGCAPATPLGPALQTARNAIDGGAIGEVIGAAATLVYPGPEIFHHRPAGLYARGAGPLFDMAVYDIAALHFLLGPVARVAASGQRSERERQVLTGPDAGAYFAVEVPTHVIALLEFDGGATATLTSSFAGHGDDAAIVIYGTKGVMRLPRAGAFDGAVTVRAGVGGWASLPPAVPGWADDLWIIGLLETLAAAADHRAPRCAATIARHHLAVLIAIQQAIADGTWVAVTDREPRPKPMAHGSYAEFRERFDMVRL